MTEQDRSAQRTWLPRLIGWGIVLVLLIVFIAQNSDTVDVNFLWVDTDLRLAWALLIAAVLGFIAGLLAPRLWRR